MFVTKTPPPIGSELGTHPYKHFCCGIDLLIALATPSSKRALNKHFRYAALHMSCAR